MSGQTAPAGQRTWSGAARILLALTALAVVLLLSETLLRAFDYRGTHSEAEPGAALTSLFVVQNQVAGTKPARATRFHHASFCTSKPSAGKRIFAIGDSVTYGSGLVGAERDCYSGQLAALLEARFPKTPTEVINCGGIDARSSEMLAVLQECLTYEADAVVIMGGAEELLEPVSPEVPQTSAGRGHWSVLRTVQFVYDMGIGWNRGQTGRQPQLTQTALMAGQPKDLIEDPRKIEEAVARFRHNLDRMVTRCQDHGVSVFLCTAPANLRHCGPHRSATNRKRSHQHLLVRLRRANACSAAGQPADALAIAQQVLAEDERLAAFHYIAAKSLDALGRKAEARHEYLRAKDTDALPRRALSSFNEEIRSAALRHNVGLVDLEAIFAESSPDGIPGRNLFTDHCHPNAVGHRLIAEHLATALGTALYGVPKQPAPCCRGRNSTGPR